MAESIPVEGWLGNGDALLSCCPAVDRWNVDGTVETRPAICLSACFRSLVGLNTFWYGCTYVVWIMYCFSW